MLLQATEGSAPYRYRLRPRGPISLASAAGEGGFELRLADPESAQENSGVTSGSRPKTTRFRETNRRGGRHRPPKPAELVLWRGTRRGRRRRWRVLARRPVSVAFVTRRRTPRGRLRLARSVNLGVFSSGPMYFCRCLRASSLMRALRRESISAAGPPLFVGFSDRTPSHPRRDRYRRGSRGSGREPVPCCQRPRPPRDRARRGGEWLANAALGLVHAQHAEPDERIAWNSIQRVGSGCVRDYFRMGDLP